MLLNNYFPEDNLIKFPLINPYNKTKLNSIIIEFNYNEVVKEKLVLLPVFKTLMLLTGQKPKVIKAKKSIAAFKTRKNMEIGAIVTVRNFLKFNLLKLLILNLPKLKINNFSVSLKTFDMFFPSDQRSGANVSFDISSSSVASKNLYLSSIHLY